MNSFRKLILPMSVLVATIGANVASAHPGHSHEGVPGGESHVTLLYVVAMLAVLIIATAVMYVRSRR